jgi:putative N6-adenine-specific DNA methylase
MSDPFEIFLAGTPGLEPVLADEAVRLGLTGPQAVPGGVTVQGDWRDVWRANLGLRTASRVLVRLAAFRAPHLAQLDKRARKVDWAAVLRPDVAVKVEASCSRSRIYHDRAAAERIERAIVETTGVKVAKDAGLRLMARIEDDLCTISIDTSGEPLHRRGHKVAVGKAPLRETLAAAFLWQCGYTGHEPLVDPMCGSGTLVTEAAEMALGLIPGRSRDFAFMQLASFDPEAWALLAPPPPAPTGDSLGFGFDRDAGAITRSRQNAERAGVEGVTAFATQPISDLRPPPGPPGLVLVNPPYGGRIGNPKLQPLDQARRVPAPAAHLLHILVELVDQRGHRQARAVRPRRRGRCRDPCASSPPRSHARNGRRSWSRSGSPSATPGRAPRSPRPPRARRARPSRRNAALGQALHQPRDADLVDHLGQLPRAAVAQAVRAWHRRR